MSDTVKQWIRNCPQCNSKIVYTEQSNFCRGRRTNAKCAFCAHDGQLIGRVQSDREKEMRANKLRGMKRSIPIRKQCSISKMGSKNPKFGDHTPKSEEHKRRIRLSCIKHIENKLALVGKKMRPSFSQKACNAIDEYSRKYEYNFQHAMNGGEYHIMELGYWVDGYDKEKNVVIEYYENNHWHRKNEKKDIDRRKEIMYHLGCDFIILKEEIGGSYLSRYFCR